MDRDVLSKIPGELLGLTRNGLVLDPGQRGDSGERIMVERETMSGMLLTDDEIKATITEAFSPYRCVVEILPDRLTRFQVIKQWTATPIYTEPGIPIETLREDSDLRELLRAVRLLLAKRGYQLGR